MKTLIKTTTTLVLVCCTMAYGMVAHAIPISGTFQLFNDKDGAVFAPNQLLATGSFLTSKNVRKNNYTDFTGVKYDTVKIETMTIIDETGGYLPNFFYPLDTDVSVRRLFAVLDRFDPDAILGFTGSIKNKGALPNGKIEFYGPDSGAGPSVAATFVLNAKTKVHGRIGESGIQKVPEPSALLLLGAGLIGLGFSRRRKSLVR